MKQSIILAGGCFWGVEAYFKLVDGVLDTTVGYIAGHTSNPSYEAVCSGSGHAEAVAIDYDEDTIDLKTLLEHFFNIVDPTLVNRQGPDIGVQYRTGIYNYTDTQKAIIDRYLDQLRATLKKTVYVELKTGEPFYEAESYHQDYLDKNKNGYCHVNLNSVKNVK